MISSDSCKPCLSECKTCQDSITCTSCKDPLAELNSKRQCHVLCSVFNTSSCLECPSLCSLCDINLFCLNCTSNTLRRTGSCSCLPGYSQSQDNRTCIEKYFYSNLKITSNQNLILTFNESLSASLRESDLRIRIKHVKYDFYLKQSNISSYKLIIIGLNSINKTLDVELKILKKNIYSRKKSKLFNYVIIGKIYPSSKTGIDFGSGLGPATQIAVASSVGIAMVSNPAGLWSLINTIQLITYMPINAVPYSTRLEDTATSMMNYNIIPNLFSYISNKNATKIPNNEVRDFGIDSSVIVLNIGSIWMVFITSAFSTFLLFLLARYFKRSEKIQNLYIKSKYNILIRFWIESYLELSIYGFIQVRAVRNK